MMVLVIPTRGRVGKQTTFSGLPVSLRRRTLIVCPQREVAAHAGNHPQAQDVIVQPDSEWTIARKRRWILEELCTGLGIEKVCMLDDDLRFCVRRDDNPKLFRSAEEKDVLRGFSELESKLTKKTPHAGFAARGGGISPRAQLGGWQEAKRMMYVLGYHVRTVLAESDPFRLETREDMDTTLQLLTKGIPNVVNHTFVVDQKFGNPGGCENERSIERSNADALRLAEYYPDIVRVVKKEYLKSVPRLEVVCQWEKALRLGSQR